MISILQWDDTRCEIVDLCIDVFEDNPYGFSVTHIYGSGGALMAEGDGYSSEKNAKLAAEYWFEIEGRQALMDRFLGWFDNPVEKAPAHEPEWEYCPFCTDSYRLAPDDLLVTVSLMIQGDFKSYFYRAHKACFYKDAKRVDRLEDDLTYLMEIAAKQDATPPDARQDGATE